MASETQVRTYLAHWFQLGKKLVWCNGIETILPRPIIVGHRFSDQFEECWQKIINVGGKDCYLEGSVTTIEQLLSPAWNIDKCARCEMPVPIVEQGNQPLDCVCSDLPNWPNNELPQPRLPINNYTQLDKIKARLSSK